MVNYGCQNTARIVAATLVVCLMSSITRAQKASAEDVNKANNPLTPAITLNFQDQAHDLDQWSNAFLLRGVVPHKLGGA